jgi:hypothetical protein
MKYVPKLPPMPNAEAVEIVTDNCIGGLGWDGRPLDIEALTSLREMVKVVLRLYELQLPDDTFLDELVRELCEWHDIPLVEVVP